MSRRLIVEYPFFVCAVRSQEMTFNVDGISMLDKGEIPDEGLAKELGEAIVIPVPFARCHGGWSVVRAVSCLRA